MRKLPKHFYNQANVVAVAEQLIGMIVETHFGGIITSGRIVETEAYVAFTDKASHAFNGRRTERNEHMYAKGGVAYVYICYGIHHMLNIVTNKKGIPDAVLIRALEPLEGIDMMLQRTGKLSLDYSLTKGPGNVAKALGIVKEHSGLQLGNNQINILIDQNFKITSNQIEASKRIGIASAGVDVLLPYRFYLKGNRYVSAGPVK